MLYTSVKANLNVIHVFAFSTINFWKVVLQRSVKRCSKFKEHVRTSKVSFCPSVSLGTLRSNDATATRTSLKKVCLRSFSLYSDYSYPITLSNAREANPPEAEFQGTISKLRKRNKILSLLVYVLHKTRN